MMSDENDVFDANLSRLLRGAGGPPTMDPQRKRRTLEALLLDFQRTAIGGRGRTIMMRWVRPLSYAAAILMLAGPLVFILVTSPGVVAPRPGEAEEARFRLADGTLVYPKGEARYTVVGDRHLRLEDGQLLLFVAPSDRPFVVDTPEATAEAHGTTFTIATRAAATFAAVGQGLLEVRTTVGSVKLRAGQQAWAPKGQAPRRSPAPRFSHLVNWARQHLRGKKLFQPAESRASGELVAVDPWGQQVRLELRRYHINVVIEDGIARTTVDQTFFNHLTWQIEGTFYFPLPPDASLSRLAMYVNGELNEGGMVERQYGRHVYESIVYRRRDPALLEMMEGNVFKMRVFPIFGRQEKRIILSYTQTLPQLYGTLRYWFPMEHTNDRAGGLSIRVRVKDAAGKAKALSSTHDVRARVDGDDLVVEHSATDVAPNRDFLLHLSPEGTEDWSAPAASFRQGNHHFLSVRCRPQINAPVQTRPRQWFILNDVSASRSSVDVKAQAYIIERLLAEADDDDTFALVNLDTQARVWRRDLTSVRSRDGAAAVAFADVPRRLGATNIADGLRAVGRLIDQNGADNAMIVYLGDGIATDETTQTKYLLWRLPKKAVFLGLGVGKKVDARFLQAAADATGGLFAAINPNEDIRWRVFDLIAALNTPRLVDIQTRFEDEDGKAVALEAYPSTGTLCDGEVLTVLARTDKPLPARMTLTGRVGQGPFEQQYDLAGAETDAAYTPRLWASARINHLLREGAEQHKNEIISLSKEFYVVTPFTSLIVLENEADYKRWKVEMGRKDHWQLYPAPKKIKVVHEPLKHRPRAEPAAPLKGKPGHPKTIEEIVDSVQFRVYVPFYGYYPHQRRRTERFRLHALLSGRLPVVACGGIAPLPEVLNEEGVQPGGGGGGGPLPLGLGIDNLPELVSTLPGDGSRWLSLTKLVRPGAISGRSYYSYYARGTLVLDRSLTMGTPAGFLSIEGTIALDPVIRADVLRGTFTDRQGEPGLEFLLPLLLAPGSRSARAGGQVREILPEFAKIPNGRWGYAYGMGTLPGRSMELIDGHLQQLGELRIDKREGQEFGRARLRRWRRDVERLRLYNRRYGGWYSGDWDDDERDESRWLDAGARLAVSYEPLMRLGSRLEKEKINDDLMELPPLDIPPPAPGIEPADGKEELHALAPLLLRSYARSMGAVPGTVAALAADRLLPLRQKLRALKPSPKRDKAIAALDALLKQLPDLSAATESTGIFWSWQGWNVLPSRWDFQQPQCQAWPGSRAMVDLTRYARGLESTWGDVTDLVLAAFGHKPAGKVDDQAAERIAAARQNTPTMRVQYVNKKGEVLFELWAGSEDRFAWTSRSQMYLREDFVCDGKAWYHVYPELGLAARRLEAKHRFAVLRWLAPHLLPPAEELARVFNVDLAEADGPLTTIRLTPIPPKEKQAAKGGETGKLAVLVTFDERGFLRRKVWQVDGETKLACTYAYKDSRVEVAWKAEDKTLWELTYRCEPTEPSPGAFEPELKDMVVLDMPLRRPEHYQALLQEIEKDPDKLDERLRLRRHLALAQLQDFTWQSAWGSAHQAYQTVLAALQELAQAGRKTVLPGDAAIIGSTGYARTIHNQGRKLELPAAHPLLTYWLDRGNAPEMKKLAESNRGGFFGHLATYCLTYAGGNERVPVTRKLMAEYPDSPLLYAAATYCGSAEEVWLDLAKQPRWRLAALYAAAQHKPTAKVGEAFEAYHKEMTDKGWEVPISSGMAAALRVQNERWHRVLKRWLASVMKSKDVGALLRFAEFAWPYNEKELASIAIDQAREQVAKKLPLTWKLTWAQSLWAMGRTQEAWKEHQEIAAALEKDGLGPSPALLAAMARLAQQTNRPAQAVDLELRAITAEQPYMPKRVNIQLFRQRYQWLWGQLTSRVQQCAGAAKAKPDDVAAKRALEEALTCAAEVWWTWKRVDGGNTANLYEQLATMHRTAGDAAGAWRALSSLIDEKPKDGSTFYQVGRWYVNHNDRDAGQQWYARAYEVEPTNGDWIWNRAELLRQMGRTEEARVLYEEIAEKKWQPRFEHYNRKAKERLEKL